MAKIIPFQAWRYSSDKVTLQQVVTQPYDKITPSMQNNYYAASPYNLVRIILGKPEPHDNESQNVYSRAAQYLADWQKSGALRRDPQPCFYSYSQTFTVPGETRTAERRSLIALGKLEEYSAGIVYRHELTHSKAKADRLSLLRATRSHFGQIFMLYDGAPDVDQLLRSTQPADIDVTDEYGVVHRVWAISDSKVVHAVQNSLSSSRLLIADGHHRYETALNYRNEQRAAKGSAEGSHDYVMMTLVSMDSPGLVILPTHRVVRDLPSFSFEHLLNGVKQFFAVDELSGEITADRATSALRKAGENGPALLCVTSQRAFILHSPTAASTKIFSGISQRQQALDVVQLHKCVLEQVLGMSEEEIRNQQNISYYRDAAEALLEVQKSGAQAAFLMNPVKIGQMRDVAFAGEVMPQKSTDFYPKMLSGLTIYSLD